MRTLRLHIWLTVCLFFPLAVEGQTHSAVDTTAMMHSDYITASLLVVEPSSEVYSMFGHCALRLNCPSQQMDYCFTFETSTDSKGILNFFIGQSMGGFAPAPTKDYLDYYRQEQRGVTQYELNLTPAEKLQLWRTADEEVARGHYWHYDYRRIQCASMLIYLVEKALEQPITYGELSEQLQGTQRHQGLIEGKPFPWSVFCFQTIKGSEFDTSVPIEEKMTPRTLPFAWQHATIDDSRPLITDSGKTLVSGQPIEAAFFTPTHACALLLIIALVASYGQWHYGWQLFPQVSDLLLLAIFIVLTFVVTTVVLFSKYTGVEWNWYLPVFNPLPLVLWLIPRCRKVLLWCMGAVLLVCILLTPFIPQYDLPHALLMGCLLVGVLHHLPTLKLATHK